ncbi:MAG: VPLPA-CTERM sorting domain-containing protein [Paracoccaceae bacterium]
MRNLVKTVLISSALVVGVAGATSAATVRSERAQVTLFSSAGGAGQTGRAQSPRFGNNAAGSLAMASSFLNSGALDPVSQARLQALVDNALTMVRKGIQAKAFQLSVQEIVGDGASVLDLTSGNFVAGRTNKKVRRLSDQWLAAIANGPWAPVFPSTPSGGTTGTRVGGGTQNPSPVPVPAAGFLMVAGLAGLGALRRARRAS